MHPLQATLLSQVLGLTKKLSAKSQGTSLWAYTDPEGKEFYLPEKLATVKSPYSGKSFSAKPKKYTPAQIGQELREKAAALEARLAAHAAGHDVWAAG